MFWEIGHSQKDTNCSRALGINDMMAPIKPTEDLELPDLSAITTLYSVTTRRS
jgi:hypothetical protein